MILKDILSETDDEILLMNLVEYFTSQANFDINKLPEVPRNVVAAVTAQAVIDNGGFRYFFESEFDGKANYQIFVQAYRAIAATESAEAIEQVLEMFPTGEPPQNWRQKEKCIAEIFAAADRADSFINTIQDKILGNDNNYVLMAKYVRENIYNF